MRVILFRGKRIDNGEWKCGSYVHQYGCHEIFLESCEGEYGFDRYHVAPETVGQFTGLTDKNGKWIFEGDILSVMVNEVEESDKLIELGISDKKTKVPTGNRIKAVWTVEWKCFSRYMGFRASGKDRRFNIPLTKNSIFNAHAEVIGNIHDNPELIGERKESNG
jgi:uncharacterized phage protein (TIGR01671 family)